MSNQEKLDQAAEEASFEMTGGATLEVVDGAGDTPYLSKEMLTDGSARNVVTVKITTNATSFVVDVLKTNKMHGVYRSKYKEKLIELSQVNGDGTVLSDELLEVNHHYNRETICDNILKPAITLAPSPNALYIDEVPADVQDLLLAAFDAVNDERGVAQAVDTFRKKNGKRSRNR